MDLSTVGTTSTVGQWVAIAGVIGMILNAFGINILPTDIEKVLEAGVIMYGIIHSLIAHYNLKTVAGMNQN